PRQRVADTTDAPVSGARVVALSTSSPEITAPVVELVPPGRWTIDPDHSTVGFVVQHLGITRLRGRFAGVNGSFAVADGVVSGTATVSANSFSTGSDARDNHVKGPDFLHAEAYPRIAFEVEAVRSGSGDFVVDGTLSLHGETREIAFNAVSGGLAKDPYGHDRVGISMTARIMRSDYGIRFDPTGALVSDAVDLEVDLSLVRQPAYLRDAERRHEDITHG
ncbi:MAG: YceI family protein, partial [Gaiellales bacterium]